MDVAEAKRFVDVSHEAGRSRDETAELISILPINGERSEVFEYINTKYLTLPEVTTYNFTDAENAEYFVNLFNDRLRYDHRRGRWLEWHGHYWRTDTDGQIRRLALKSARARWSATADITDSDLRTKVTIKAIQSEQRARLENALALACNFKPLADSGENWDKEQMLFAVENGVIDLETGELRTGQQSDMITMHSPIEYDPDAKAPRWEQYLKEVFDDNAELIDWLQRFLGYTLTGSVIEQIIPIAYGSGANGKTVFMVVTRHVLGDYAYDAPFSTFELYNRNPIPNDLAVLDGKRFVTSSETNEGSRFNESRIKSLTGGDSVTARFLHHEFFTYQPVMKFFLAVNHRPYVRDDSYGFWRRVRLIPFTRQFRGTDDDKALTRKLIAEAPGILTWMVQGCLKWQRKGMDPTPECIVAATKEYEAESDPLAEFILDECVITGQAHVQSSRLYKSYKEWCHTQGMQDREILTLNAFGRRMGQNFKKNHKEGGAVYFGLALKADGYLTEFVPTSPKNEFFPDSLYARENNCENSSESVSTNENSSESVSFKKNTSVNHLPDCPKCGKNEWTFSGNGKYLICPCGKKLKQGD